MVPVWFLVLNKSNDDDTSAPPLASAGATDARTITFTQLEWRGAPGYPVPLDGFPVALSGAPTGAPAVADVDGDDDLEIVFTTDDRYLHAVNHEIILQSQRYGTRQAAINGVLSVLDNAENTARYEIAQAANGEYYFTLDARNGRVIGISETYTTRYSAERGAQGVRRNVGRYLDWQANRAGARFDVFRGNDGRFYFNLHAQNGEIVLSSQGYSSEEAAYNGVFSVQENGVDVNRYDVNPSANGGYYFNLKARNGRVIGTSEVYASRGNAERGCAAVVDLTGTVEIF